MSIDLVVAETGQHLPGLQYEPFQKYAKRCQTTVKKNSNAQKCHALRLSYTIHVNGIASTPVKALHPHFE